MPKKLTDCVRDVKAQGKSDDSAWGICVASTGEKPHKETKEHHNPLDIPFGYEVKNRAIDKTQEKSYPWGQCISDQKKAGHDQNSANKICGSIKGKYGETKKVQEKINKNRQVPFSNPPLRDESNKPDNRKTTKGIGGDRLNMESFLWKDILDGQLRRNVKEPRL